MYLNMNEKQRIQNDEEFRTAPQIVHLENDAHPRKGQRERIVGRRSSKRSVKRYKRINRWSFNLSWLFLWAFLAIIAAIVGDRETMDHGVNSALHAISAGCSAGYFVQLNNRLHDFGWSVLPVIIIFALGISASISSRNEILFAASFGFLLIVHLIAMFHRGDRGANYYGPAPMN